jgi:hypothetical protein
MRIKAR